MYFISISIQLINIFIFFEIYFINIYILDSHLFSALFNRNYFICYIVVY